MAVRYERKVLNAHDVAAANYGLEMNVVNIFSPGEFIVEFNEGISDVEGKAFKELNDFLRLKSVANLSISQHQPVEDEIVAVKPEADSEWRPFWHMRYNQTVSGIVAEGLFLDTGHYTEIKAHRSVKLPAEFNFPMRYRKVILNNLVSAERCSRHTGYPWERNSQVCLCKGESAWSARTVQVVRTLTKIAHQIYVIPHKSLIMQKYISKIFGVVVLIIDRQPVDLNQLLVYNNLCIEHEERFLEMYPERVVADEYEAQGQSGQIANGGETEHVAEVEKEICVVPLTEEEFDRSLPDYFRRRGSSALDYGAKGVYKSIFDEQRDSSFVRPPKTTSTSRQGAEAEEQEASLVNDETQVAQDQPGLDLFSRLAAACRD